MVMLPLGMPTSHIQVPPLFPIHLATNVPKRQNAQSTLACLLVTQETWLKFLDLCFSLDQL